MLSIGSTRSSRNCDAVSRRDFINIGSLAFGSLTLPHLLAAKSLAEKSEDFLRDKSVVLLYLSGGASHIETFDPKMTAPEGVRSVTGEVQTSVAGRYVRRNISQLAKHADKMAVVRSFTHPIGGHEQAHVHVLSGGTDPQGNQAFGQSMGSVFARIRGTNHPKNGLPTYTLLTEREIDNQYTKESGRIKKGSWPGILGPVYGPFEHQVGWEAAEADGEKDRSKRKERTPANPLAASMRLNISAEQLDNRMALLRSIDQLKRRLDRDASVQAVDKFHSQAMNLVLGGATQAFELDRERSKTRFAVRYKSHPHWLQEISAVNTWQAIARRATPLRSRLWLCHST